MARLRFAVTTSILGFALAGGLALPASSAAAIAGKVLDASSPLPSSTSSPPFRPAADSVSGRVVRLTAGGAILDSAGRQIEVTFREIVDVWRETSVPTTAIEVGDDVFINGTDGSPFVARYIWANIARIDAVIREIDDSGMNVDVFPRTGGTKRQRVDFSPYVEYGYPGGPKTTRADLRVGQTIGAVIYGQAGGPLRATRIWL